MEEEQIIATLTPNVNKRIIWKSSNNNVAIVDNNGKIIGVGRGKAIISAIIDDIKKDITVYVLRENEYKKEKTIYGVFDETEIKSCNKGMNSCRIVAPKITKEGYEILGWSLDKNSKEASI